MARETIGRKFFLKELSGALLTGWGITAFIGLFRRKKEHLPKGGRFAGRFFGEEERNETFAVEIRKDSRTVAREEERT